MTRIGMLLLIMSSAIPAFGAKGPRHDCQGDLFSQPSVKIPQSTQKRHNFSDLTLMQKQLWELRATGPREDYLHLKNRMEIQLKLSRRDQFIGLTGRKNHRLYGIAEVSMALLRNNQWGFPELVAFELNEALGGPLNIPLTVSQSDGALQLWFGYSAQPTKYLKEDEQHLWQRIDADGDLKLFLYLTATHDMNIDKVQLDRDLGLVISDFGNSFHLDKEVSTENLRQMILQSHFNWKSALNRMDMERIIDLADFRLSKAHARTLSARLNNLRTILNNEDFPQFTKP